MFIFFKNNFPTLLPTMLRIPGPSPILRKLSSKKAPS